MKTSLLLALPFLFVACSDLTPTDEEKTVKKNQAPKTPEAPEEPPPPAVPDPNESLFMDPDTTSELIGDHQKKTIVGPKFPPAPKTTPDSAITVDPPKLPEVKIPEEN